VDAERDGEEQREEKLTAIKKYRIGSIVKIIKADEKNEAGGEWKRSILIIESKYCSRVVIGRSGREAGSESEE